MTQDGWARILEKLNPWRKLGVWEQEGGNCAIGHLPKGPPTAYLHWLYAPAPPRNVVAICKSMPVGIPDAYQRFLTFTNGASFFGGTAEYGKILSLRGLVDLNLREATMSAAQPVSLRYGNNFGRRHNIDPSHFVIGSIIGENAITELAMWPDGSVRLLAPFPNDETILEWPSLEVMLISELSRLEVLHNEDGLFVGQMHERLPEPARKYD